MTKRLVPALCLLLQACAPAPGAHEEIGRYLQTRDPRTGAVVSQIAFANQEVCIGALARMATLPALRPLADFIGCSPLSASRELAVRATLYDASFGAPIVVETATQEGCTTLTEGLLHTAPRRGVRLAADCAAKRVGDLPQVDH